MTTTNTTCRAGRDLSDGRACDCPRPHCPICQGSGVEEQESDGSVPTCQACDGSGLEFCWSCDADVVAVAFDAETPVCAAHALAEKAA